MNIRPIRKRPFRIYYTILLIIFFILFSKALNASEQQVIVKKAHTTLESYLSDPDFEWFTKNMKDAKAIFIIPQFLKGAFVFGGAGGSGVVLAKNEKTGEWSHPGFYSMISASFGLQFGAQASELILMVMTQKGVLPFKNASFKLGVEASAAIGPKGGSMEGSTPYNLSADYLSFARSKGVFLGLSVEGAVIGVKNEWNWKYYGKPVSPRDIIIKNSVENPGAVQLIDLISKATN
ncbi:MAG TPA: lipid-binding SYLF domain-containing protein [Deltaproteobacteria bacterium]|nr:lipid-binding SYLF domain-containing protein [Deltaproteobacteria bacterium]